MHSINDIGGGIFRQSPDARHPLITCRQQCKAGSCQQCGMLQLYNIRNDSEVLRAACALGSAGSFGVEAAERLEAKRAVRPRGDGARSLAFVRHHPDAIRGEVVADDADGVGQADNDDGWASA